MKSKAAPSTSFHAAGDALPSPAGFLMPEDICRMLCIAHSTLQKMVQRKAIPHYRIGYRTIRFKESEIKAWIEKKRVIINPFTLVRVKRANGQKIGG